MELITLQDMQNMLKLKKLGFFGKLISWMVIKLLKIDKINKLYNENKDLSTEDFLNAILKNANVNFEIHEDDLKRIPTNGPLIVISNHPMGFIDGFISMKILLKVRPDFKGFGNFLVMKIKPMAKHIIPVNPFAEKKELFRNKDSILAAYEHLQNGNCLSTFPSGEISHYNPTTDEYIDKEWPISSIRFIKNANVTIVPMYFHGKNSNFFYRLHKIHPYLRMAMIPIETLRKRKKPIKVRVGKPISVQQQEKYTNLREYEKFLRDKIYILRSYYYSSNNKEYLKSANLLDISDITKSITSPFVKNIVEETPKELLVKEVDFLRELNCRLLTNNNYEVFLASAERIPAILREIGRLREISFREIGEGTKRSIDLDEFDQFYKHLFLWDNENKTIVGAYRMGLGKSIFKKYGINGFYTTCLYKYDKELYPFFEDAIEMGRAFIRKEYQQKPFPLFLLWKGIIHVCFRYPDHKYLIGGVSISNQFSNFSKAIMIEFMRSYYFDSYLAQYAHPRHEFKVKLKDNEKELFLNNASNDLNKFDKLIDELEPSLRLPVLIKKYIKQNARVIAFNVDPKFSNAVDGLMYIKISDIPEGTIRPVLEELQNEISI